MNSASPITCVYLLDDDLEFLKPICRLLQEERFEVKPFLHPAAFLAAIEEEPCPVAVLDVSMPVMDGLEVQASLRRIAPGTRVIFLSGQGDAATREAALGNGAVAFLNKPCQGAELIEAIRRAMDGAA